MGCNALGRDVSGSANPNWKGGPVAKTCEVCARPYTVKHVHSASRFCSMQCVGISQRKTTPEHTLATLACEVCAAPFSVPASHARRHHCCSKACSAVRRSRVYRGPTASNWIGGVSRLPYPWNFKEISRRVIERDGGECQSPACRGVDQRLTAHHIDYDKENCADDNLITLCSSCNSRANFHRVRWTGFYAHLMRAKKNGGGGYIARAFKPMEDAA